MLDFTRDANHQAFWAAGTVLDVLYDFKIPINSVVIISLVPKRLVDFGYVKR